MAIPNTPLRSLITLRAARPDGMLCNEFAGDASDPHTPHVVSSICRRMTAEGLLHMTAITRAHRYFTSAEARDDYVRRNSVRAASASSGAGQASGPAAWRGTMLRPGAAPASVTGMDTAPHSVALAPHGARHAHELYHEARVLVRTPTDLPFVPRLGSTDHEVYPSRMGDRLFYRNGRTATIGAEG